MDVCPPKCYSICTNLLTDCIWSWWEVSKCYKNIKYITCVQCTMYIHCTYFKENWNNVEMRIWIFFSFFWSSNVKSAGDERSSTKSESQLNSLERQSSKYFCYLFFKTFYCGNVVISTLKNIYTLWGIFPPLVLVFMKQFMICWWVQQKGVVVT